MFLYTLVFTGYRLQFRFQIILQISEKERRAPTIRKQHVPDMAGTDDHGKLLRQDTRPVRPEAVSGSVTEFPGSISQERHMLLQNRAEDCAEEQTGPDRGQTTQRP